MPVKKSAMTDIPNLQIQFSEIKKAYQSIKKKCENKVESWFWAADTLHNLEPFYFEEHRYKKAKKLKEEPQDKSNKYHYGLNHLNEVILIRQYTGLKRELYYETFYLRTSDKIETYHFDYWEDKKLDNLTIYHYDDARLTHHVQITENGWYAYDYHYDQDKLTKKLMKTSPEADYIPEDRTFEYRYDQFGVLNTITEGEHFYYKKAAKKITFQQLTDLVTEKLFEVIRENLLELKPKEELFCIYLNYGNEAFFPPSLAMGTEEERKKWLTEHGKRAKWLMWSPADYRIDHELEMDQESSNLFELYNQETEMQQKYSLAKKAIAEVALRLKGCLQEFKLHQTPDFVIVASDYEMTDLKKNFKLINPELFEQFKKELP
jgi:hypothetical protein